MRKLFLLLMAAVSFFVLAGSAEAQIVLDPTALDAYRSIPFSQEIDITSSTGAAITDLALSRSSWNGLTLVLSASEYRITVSGTPQTSGKWTFFVSGKINGVVMPDAPFTIQVSDAARYSLTATPDVLPFTTNASAVNRVKITSSTGAVPTALTTDVDSWNGLLITVSDADSLVTVEGTPLTGGSRSVSVSGKVGGQQAAPAVFTITVKGSGDDDDGGGGSCNAALLPWLSLGLLPLLRRRGS